MATSYNGYALVLNYGDPQLMPLTANGKPFAPNPGILRGSVGIVMNYLADWLDANIEPLDLAGYEKDDWCYTQKKVTGGDGTLWSCHFSATAFDYNAQKHVQHRTGTWLPWQKSAINTFLSGYLEGSVIWGENWSTASIDGMHFEAGRNKILMDRVALKIIGSGPGPIISRPTIPDPQAPIPAPLPVEDDLLMALSQYQQEETHNAVVDTNNRTADLAVKVDRLLGLLTVPKYGFGYPEATHNAVGTVIGMLGGAKLAAGEIDVADLAKQLKAVLAPAIAADLAKRLAA